MKLQSFSWKDQLFRGIAYTHCPVQLHDASYYSGLFGAGYNVSKISATIKGNF